jgi:hypothetical protein
MAGFGPHSSLFFKVNGIAMHNLHIQLLLTFSKVKVVSMLHRVFLSDGQPAAVDLSFGRRAVNR